MATERQRGGRAIVERPAEGSGLGAAAAEEAPLAKKGGLLRRALGRLVDETTDGEYWARIAELKRETNEFGVDPFGVDPDWIGGVGTLAFWLYKHYFRVEAQGVENVPAGRVLVISNHSGVIPFDGAMIATSMLLLGDPPRVPRTAVERWSAIIPWINVMLMRTGQFIGLPDNARRLLENDHPVLVFPEGAPGSNKMFNKAYQLQDFGLGFMRLALETRSPIVPVAVIGAEEQYPAVYNARKVASLIGAPALPVTPFAAIPLIGLLPLPTKYRLYFGEPMTFDGDFDDDDEVVAEKVWLVRSTIQNMVNRGLRDREHVFW